MRLSEGTLQALYKEHSSDVGDVEESLFVRSQCVGWSRPLV